MSAAHLIAARGTCSRRQVGAVLADLRGTIFVWAYNGALSGFPHCAPHEDYQPCDVSEHAERNAIFWAARKGIATEGLQLFSTDAPCPACARAIIQSGIKRVVYDRPYRENVGLLVLQAGQIELVRFGDL